MPQHRGSGQAYIYKQTGTQTPWGAHRPGLGGNCYRAVWLFDKHDQKHLQASTSVWRPQAQRIAHLPQPFAVHNTGPAAFPQAR
eukprot:scaffold549_cov385-Prasinococcus_capsulatus_cf.AAC.21